MNLKNVASIIQPNVINSPKKKELIILKRIASVINQCKKPVTKGKFHLDHIKALANGGTNKPKNIQVLCISCHADKTKAEKENG